MPLDIAVEDAISYKATSKLLEQLQEKKETYGVKYAGHTPDKFYSNLIKGRITDLRLHVIGDGEDKGKLTLEYRSDDQVTWEIDLLLEPVDCYNLVKEGEDLAKAVRRLSLEGKI